MSCGCPNLKSIRAEPKRSEYDSIHCPGHTNGWWTCSGFFDLEPDFHHGQRSGTVLEARSSYFAQVLALYTWIRFMREQKVALPGWQPQYHYTSTGADEGKLPEMEWSYMHE